MLNNLDALIQGFEATIEKSKKDCGETLEKIRQLIFIISDFDKTAREFYAVGGKINPTYNNSLIFTCYLELYRTSGHILYLTANGLYRNAYDNIRHVIESVVQALYLDTRHPESQAITRIEILKEVEDKREYHAVRLIDELKGIDHKDILRTEYKEFSRIIHPSHRDIIATMIDIKRNEPFPAIVDCQEVAKIHRSMEVMYDIFFYFFLNCFSEIKEELQKNQKFLERIKIHELVLLSKVFNIRITRK